MNSKAQYPLTDQGFFASMREIKLFSFLELRLEKKDLILTRGKKNLVSPAPFAGRKGADMKKLWAAVLAAVTLGPVCWTQEAGVGLDELQDSAVVGGPVERPAAGEMIGTPSTPETGKRGETARDGATRLSLIVWMVRWAKHGLLALGLIATGLLPYLVSAKCWQLSVRAYDRQCVDRGRLFAHRAMLAREDWGNKAIFPASALALVWIGSFGCLVLLIALRWLEIWQRRNPGRLKPLVRRVFRFAARLTQKVRRSP